MPDIKIIFYEATEGTGKVMVFWDMFCTNVAGVAISTFFLLLASRLLFGRRLHQFRERRWTVLAVTVLYIVSFALVGTICYKTGIFGWKYRMGKILFNYMGMLGSACYLWFLYGESFPVSWVSAVFFQMIEELASSFSLLFSQSGEFNLEIFHERIIYLFFTYLLTPMFHTALILAFYKSGVGGMCWQWVDRNKTRLRSLVFISMYPVLSQVLHMLVHEGRKAGEDNDMVSLMFFLVMFLVLSFEGREELHRKQMKVKQVSLQQQAAYIETLEGLQQEMRRFRHDYKNMVSGIYLQAKEGDLESVQQFIQDMAEDFDVQVGGQIRLLTQLGNVHMLEVKGLLLGKIKECSGDQIEFGLEVLRPLEKTRLRATDLCRCLGILIDNAMDEVRGKEHPRIHIMVSCQEGCTTFRVKNKLYSQVDFHKIWQQGYSTRGTDRGIGLASYRNILRRYEDVFPSTAIQDGCFVQELKIQE